MRKSIVIILIISIILIAGCETPTDNTILQTEKVCECSNIDLSEYDQKIEDLQKEVIFLRKNLGIVVNDLYITKEELNITQGISEELEQLKKELEEDIERVDTRIDIQNCRDKGGEWVNNECRMPYEEQPEWDLSDYPNPFG